jgi:hypothetical protein
MAQAQQINVQGLVPPSCMAQEQQINARVIAPLVATVQARLLSAQVHVLLVDMVSVLVLNAQTHAPLDTILMRVHSSVPLAQLVPMVLHQVFHLINALV